MSALFSRARIKLLAFVTITTACSLFAPTDEEIAGGTAVHGGSGGASGASGTTGGATAQTGGSKSGGNGSGGGATVVTGGTSAEGGVGQGGAPDAGAAGDPAGASGGSASGGSASGGSASGGSASGGSASGGSVSGGSASGGSASGGSASGGSPATGGSGSCVPDVTSARSKASSLQDDFSNGTPAPSFFVNGGPSTCATEMNGNVLVSLPNPAPASEYCYYQTSSAYDLTCDAILLKVSQTTRKVAGLQTFLYVIPDATHKLFVVVENGVYFLASEGGAGANGGQYDPAAPWWRLREVSSGDGRLVIFDTSSDGVVWNERARIARPFPLNDVKIAFGAGAYQVTASPGTGTFSCYNAPPSCR